MGSFDGVHLGHQQVIALAADAARDLGAPLGVITFDPHPRVYFRPDEPAFHLMQPEQQARALEKLGVDMLYVLPLDAELAATLAQVRHGLAIARLNQALGVEP
jgi:riboflavin kinase/FMN adenylyltransferase